MCKLYDIEHPYYCAEGNYFVGGMTAISEYDSWEAFLAEWGDSDLDMNLVVRWDWHKPSEDEERETDVLDIFILGQRKAVWQSTHTKVTPEDEPAVRAWLEPRWQRIRENWAPIPEGA